MFRINQFLNSVHHLLFSKEQYFRNWFRFHLQLEMWGGTYSVGSSRNNYFQLPLDNLCQSTAIIYAPGNRFCPWEIRGNMQSKLWKMQDFRFPQHFCWGFRSCGMWHCVTALLPHSLKKCSAFLFSAQRWRQDITSKCQETLTHQHNVTSQKIWTLKNCRNTHEGLKIIQPYFPFYKTWS